MTLLALIYGSIVGLSLGLTGGGGSIFAVPLLVYGLHFEFREAVVTSLAIVGGTAVYGVFLHSKKKQILLIAGSVMGVGGLFGVPLGSAIGTSISDHASLVLFATLMAFIGARTLRPKHHSQTAQRSWISCDPQVTTPTPRCVAKLLGAGFITGTLSGLLGVGGGFLLIPALRKVIHAPIDKAMATSLVSIALIASSGFLQNLSNLSTTHATASLLFFLGSAIGMRIGHAIKGRCSQRALEIAFGSGVLATAAFMIVRSVWYSS